MIPFALPRHFRRLALTATCLLSFVGAESQAKPPELSAAIAAPAPQNLGEMLENLGRIYSNKSNPIMQEFWLLGRYHGQQHWSDGNTGQYEESFENRRLRMGL